MLLRFEYDVGQVDAAQAGVFQEQADEKALALSGFFKCRVDSQCSTI